MVLRLRQHNIGYTADGFTGPMTQPTVSKHWRRVVSHPDRPQSNHAHLTVLQYYNKKWQCVTTQALATTGNVMQRSIVRRLQNDSDSTNVMCCGRLFQTPVSVSQWPEKLGHWWWTV